MIKQAVILCGGAGTRLNDGVRFQPAIEIPKPLMEVGGKPFVTYAINMLKGIGVTDIVLLVGYMMDTYEILGDETVRLVETQEDVNKAVLDIPNLDDTFILLNGDCFPIMDWRAFCDTRVSRIAIKIIDRDAGIAIVEKIYVTQGIVDCSRIGEKMREIFPHYTILGGLHIGTYQGLERARQFMDIVVLGQE